MVYIFYFNLECFFTTVLQHSNPQMLYENILDQRTTFLWPLDKLFCSFVSLCIHKA